MSAHARSLAHHQQQYNRAMYDNTVKETELLVEERRLCKENPGVKAAWEQYQIMLNLSRSA